MSQSINDFNHTIRNSILAMFIGDEIGRGASRTVFEVLHDSSLVMKVERTGRTFHNQTEYLVWQEVKNWPIGDWFSPVVDIDSYGNVLFQKKTTPFESEKEFNAALTMTRGGVLPRVFDDIHFANFGMLDGRVTCHDYGYHTFFEQVSRDMSIDAGYITFDKDEPVAYDVTEGGQLALNL